MDGPWTPESIKRYRQRDYDGLSLSSDTVWTPQDLAFLKDIDGIRCFSYRGKLHDDVDAFEVDSLESLTLMTGSRRTVPGVVQPRLSTLCLTNRPGIEVRQKWPNLRFLRVDNWRSTNLQMVAGSENLTTIDLGGRRQQGSLEGIESCSALETLRLVNCSVDSLEPLKSLDSLSDVSLAAATPTPSQGPLDLSFIRSPKLSRLWIVNAGRLLNLESLAEHAVLREVRFIDCRLSEDKLKELSGLPSWVKVEVVDR